ncbi:unnamed protein product [Sympodiomycopsis kandeliae]
MSSSTLSNHYIRRLTSTQKACFICSRPTPVVLVSVKAQAEDFFYICANHLNDRNFATLIPQQQQQQQQQQQSKQEERLPDKVSKEEIERVKQEWIARQAAKKDKKADENKDSDKKEEEQQKGWLAYIASTIKDSTIGASSAPANKPAVTASTPPPAAASTTTPPSHEHYALHRSFYQMRIDAYNKKVAIKRAKELNFPAVPT